MPTEIIMPKVDMDMETGKIAAWHVQEGATVSKGDPIFDIETDKAAMEVEAPADGTLHHPVPEGADVAIGAPVGWLYAKGEAVGDPPAEKTPTPDVPAKAPDGEPETESPNARPAASGKETAADDDKPRATPKARKLARDAGIDLATLNGSGPHGRIQAADVAVLEDGPRHMLAPVGFKDEAGPLSVIRSKGGAGTPIVMIHGFANEAAAWSPIEAHLNERPLIRIELPCHGKSPRRRLTGFADLVSDIRRAFDDLDLQSAHLVGHSLGGAVALAIADTRASRVDSLTLIAPAGLGPDINGAVLDGIGRATRAESLGPWLRQLVADETVITDRYVRAAMMARRDPALRAAQRAMAETLFPDGTQSFDLRPALGRIAKPARIIWGKRDAIIDWRHALCAPGPVALHLFDGLGHLPHMEAPDAIGQCIAATL
ncbi:MAG: acetoin dehydrogenase dihydrolipoyllysine-residue acetyltransferase subunit [Roseitalea sp.]|jgi:pyruvate dehydrogenase E2 component (dihydrolipoamide acetyltransferase)|nr:acetoin dehydrogenase dihydrolipoyllysine-residue acetyltransferase subunit [Roseitalea sp.]MBO6720336.1 acetoin dehydrogenase dihydrolipoyllysine-residue acetyltransferase subunit [Roseitalea sp.]MBO6742696.1 acetoin dehydrogenase dihydrolipoyllysine-residue acetyltransferase subunit [Roseitalea sp.]